MLKNGATLKDVQNRINRVMKLILKKIADDIKKREKRIPTGDEETIAINGTQKVIEKLIQKNQRNPHPRWARGYRSPRSQNTRVHPKICSRSRSMAAAIWKRSVYYPSLHYKKPRSHQNYPNFNSIFQGVIA